MIDRTESAERDEVMKRWMQRKAEGNRRVYVDSADVSVPYGPDVR